MTMTLPTLPDLPAGYIVTADDMNNLADACTFLLTKPIAHVTDSAGSQTISGTAAAIDFAQADIDTDGMWDSGYTSQLTVQTAGWYKVRYCVFATGSSATSLNAYIRSTTGVNNPSGFDNTLIAWPSYCELASGGGAGGGCRGGGLWPVYMYEGDYFEVLCAGGSSSTEAGVSYLSAEYVSLF
jgi:hypothetical protein